jgi:hypothetical protein
MSTVLQLVSTCLYVLVAIVSLVMAEKSLRASAFLSFQEAAAGQSWDTVGTGLQAVIITLLRLSGLGFLIVGLGLLIAAVANNVHGGLGVTLALASLSLLFCLGLAVFNRRLQAQTGGPTPWRGSLYAAIAVAIALVLSIAR